MPQPDIHIKASPDAWRVNEQLELTFAGHGEHAYFYVEKRSLNTLDVARRLAEACGVGLQQIGYAGLKDKHAITRQWFSVPYGNDDWPLPNDVPGAAEDDVLAGMRCLRIERHTHKLRHGVHRSNEFVLRLSTKVDLDCAGLAAMDDWFPNFFGPQRVSSSNVAAARQWLAQGARQNARGRPARNAKRRNTARGGRRGWYLSVLRSELFNAVLKQRVALGNYTQAIDGDVLADGMPTGPLWGRGRSPTSALAAEIEQQALQPHQAVCEALEFTGVQQSRRALALRPCGFRVNPVEQTHQGAADALTNIEVGFELPPGAYATTLLAHHFTVHDDSKPI